MINILTDKLRTTRNIFNGYQKYVEGIPFLTKYNLLRSFIKNRMKNNAPLVWIIGLTYKCQCNCVHCCVGCLNHWKREKEISTSEVKHLINQSYEMGTMIVSLFGGEPLLRKDILELVDYISSKSMYPHLETNGLLATIQKIKQLKKSGLISMSISIDSPYPEKHDELRGVKGCFKKAIKAVDYALDQGIKCQISTYVSKGSIDDGSLQEIIRLGKEIGVTGVRVMNPVPSGKWLNFENVTLNKKEQRFLMKLTKDPLIHLDSIRSSLILRKGLKHVYNITTPFVSPYGDVQPSSFLPLSFGNLREESLNLIWGRMSKDKIFKNKNTFSLSLMEHKGFRKKYISKIKPGLELPLDIREI